MSNRRILFLIAMSALITVNGEVFYVSVNGDDANDGSFSSPWQTISHAAENVSAGDTVMVMAGTYSEQVFFTVSGSADNYIVFMPYQDDTVIVDGSSVQLNDWGALLYIYYADYIKIQGFRVQNAGPDFNAAGILAYHANHIFIENNHTYNTTSSGIGVWYSNDVKVLNNEVELACNDGEQECISVDHSGNVEVAYNYVHHGGPGTRGGEGIDIKNGSHDVIVHHNRVFRTNRIGIYIDAWDTHTYNIEVFQNRVSYCSDGFAISSEMGGLLENVRIYNNIADSNGCYGIVVTNWDDSSISHPMQNIYIINNTFHGNGGSDWGVGISVENPDIQNLVIRNNISCYNSHYQYVVETEDLGVPLSEITSDHNLLYGGELGFPDEIVDSCIVGDPSFVAMDTGDLHLTANSAAVDSGSPLLAPSVDFDGVARPQGNAWDIGAYEYAAGGIISEDHTTNTDVKTPEGRVEIFHGEYVLRCKPRTVVEIYDVSGKKLVHKEINEAGLWTWRPHSDLPTGIYIAKIRSSDGAMWMKLIYLK